MNDVARLGLSASPSALWSENNQFAELIGKMLFKVSPLPIDLYLSWPFV